MSFKCQIKDLRLIINDEKCQESLAVSANRQKKYKKNKELSNVAFAVGQLIFSKIKTKNTELVHFFFFGRIKFLCILQRQVLIFLCLLLVLVFLCLSDQRFYRTLNTVYFFIGPLINFNHGYM